MLVSVEPEPSQLVGECREGDLGVVGWVVGGDKVRTADRVCFPRVEKTVRPETQPRTVEPEPGAEITVLDSRASPSCFRTVSALSFCLGTSFSPCGCALLDAHWAWRSR